MFDNEQDVRLMLAVKENDSEQALRKIYDTYRRPICKFFYRCTCDYTTSQDYAQEVFLRLWKSRKRYQATGRFSTYIFQIAKNLWLNEWDKRRRRPAELPLDGERYNQKGEPVRDQHEAQGVGPPGHLLQKEHEERVARAIGTLPEKLRLVFAMSQIQGLKYREVAEILDIPEGTVKSRMSRAVKFLRDHFQPYFEEETGRSSG
ncbi:MAG: RNA polymerase sigma factor [Planctomycetes bacterium]|nr:RNA polymerase sigma factor [Planctomycetota bacterium]